ncbi:hypothetical protein ACFORH_43540 [Amycolatopsis roodepoortensis]|uniref:Polynucleotide kinase n=1 Tax=Amycolatopsis roodepoortensis TaxID=700274 RepID=A0ABR9LI73_9PSEU|nr:hypothetical protein [Amycolatopsis roodepoortensis]MBE1580381.1 hypothetical protein [Amycolatopsis roodepoortensis]
MSERRLAVMDVDGVVADAVWRLPLLGDDPASASRQAWAAFFDAAGDDPLIPSGRALACQLAVGRDICWLTARSDRTRALTVAWFAHHDLPRGELRMRPNDDLRPSPVWKIEQLHELAKTREIDIVVDDDERVVAMASDQGFPAMFPPAASTPRHHLA